VRLAPITVQNVVTYTVVIDVPNPDLKLRPGMTATVSILIDERDNALRVPTLALRFQPPADASMKTGDQGQQGAAPVSDTERQRANRPDGGMQGGGQRMRQGGGGGQGGPGQWANRKGDGSPDQGQSRRQQIWVMDANKNLRPVMVTTGLSDNRYVEITGGELKEGDDVVIGLAAVETASAPNQQNNPFAPRGMGPGGGRGR
jgi:HlyD family secretion protein